MTFSTQSDCQQWIGWLCSEKNNEKKISDLSQESNPGLDNLESNKLTQDQHNKLTRGRV